MNSSDVIAEPAQHTLIRQLVDRFGDRLLSDTAMCRSVLSDHGSSFSKREVHALTGAVSLGMPIKLRTSVGSAGGWLLQRQVIADRMHEEIGLESELALWAADLWAVGTSTVDVNEIRRVRSAGSKLNSADALNVLNGFQAGASKTTALTPGTNRLIVEVTKLKFENDDWVFHLRIDNSTPLNFTDLDLKATMYDSDGDMIGETSVGVNRVKPKSLKNIDEMLLFEDCVISSIAIEVCEYSKVGREYIASIIEEDEDAEITSILKSTELIVTTSVSGLSIRQSRGALLDSLA